MDRDHAKLRESLIRSKSSHYLSRTTENLNSNTGSTSVDIEVEATKVNVRIQKAAFLVEQAMVGREMPLEVIQNEQYKLARLAFTLYSYLGGLRHFLVVIYLLVPFFEIPQWCITKNFIPPSGGKMDKYPLSDLPYFPIWIVYLIDIFVLLVFAAFLYLQYLSYGSLTFKRNKVIVYKAVLISYGLIDRTTGIVLLIFKIYFFNFQVFPYVRVILSVLQSKSLRGCFRTILRISRDFFPVAVLMSIFVLLSSWMAYILFQWSPQSSLFPSFPSTLLQMFILLTTANNPDIWVPAFTQSRISFLFFSCYISLGLFFLMNLLLSVIYTSYKSQMALKAEKKESSRIKSLKAAFSLLDPPGKRWVSPATMSQLFVAMDHIEQDLEDEQSSILRRIVFTLRPKIEPRVSLNLRKHGPEIFLALDKRKDFKIWDDEFEAFCDIVGKDFSSFEGESSSDLESSGLNDHFLLKFTRETWFEALVNFVVLSGLVVVLFESTLNGGTMKYTLLSVELGFVSMWALEVILKILSYQGWAYFCNFWSKFDFACTCGAIIGKVFAFMFPKLSIFFISCLRGFIAVRSLRLITVLSHFATWNTIRKSVLSLLPVFLPILGLQWSICSLFSILGIHLFGGLIYEGNPDLKDSTYLENGFSVFNFNDFGSGMVTTFNLCVVNNWFIIMDGFASATRSNFSRTFFIAFYVLAVLLVLNLVIAMILELFLDEMEAQRQLQEERKSGNSSSNLASIRASRPLDLFSRNAKLVYPRTISSSTECEGNQPEKPFESLRTSSTMNLLRGLANSEVDMATLQNDLGHIG